MWNWREGACIAQLLAAKVLSILLAWKTRVPSEMDNWDFYKLWGKTLHKFTNAVNEDLQPRTWCIAYEYEMMNDRHSINKSATIVFTTMECGDHVIPADQLNLFMTLIQAMKKSDCDDFHSVYTYQVVPCEIMILPIYYYSENLLQMIIQANCNFWERKCLTYTTSACSHQYTTTVSYTLVLIHDFVHDLWMKDSCTKDSCTKRWWFQEASTDFFPDMVSHLAEYNLSLR